MHFRYELSPSIGVPCVNTVWPRQLERDLPKTIVRSRGVYVGRLGRAAIYVIMSLRVTCVNADSPDLDAHMALLAFSLEICITR